MKAMIGILERVNYAKEYFALIFQKKNNNYFTRQIFCTNCIF